MLKSYPAIFHSEDTGYWVEFPEFGGGTQGDDLEEAMYNAREFLGSSIALYIDEGIVLPKMTNIEALHSPDGFVTMIQADPTPFIKNNKAVRKNVTVPEWLTKLADREGLNYSEVLTKALERRLQV
ncbi:HicB family protein [Streptococcus azizii]|uniref:HicB family protein n=1 Tax=Streptococcus azizii TaxID=1579424 RepID=A0AB36JN06_9STRE|nr:MULTISPECIES: type II toxin-antitoxin system HicB family antitoxin [Streptococcus]MBF0776241.1 type II toxin-antitoxin system HicB family antitoxin [Streptococcus sp. 19428wD3_AN2]ONK28099.1 HicB family protein [Streptococcus azizii]ONK30497.1 HicB family protein [Streptococcus azizii]ONK31024.1 HicB family protein [Streptococcus azizii]TFU83371.1 HicB family protein [Streptococcus sp. AN2]